VWRRRPQSMQKGAVFGRMTKPADLEANSQSDASGSGSRPARRRPGC
jgi:hypothetical protein